MKIRAADPDTVPQGAGTELARCHNDGFRSVLFRHPIPDSSIAFGWHGATVRKIPKPLGFLRPLMRTACQTKETKTLNIKTNVRAREVVFFLKMEFVDTVFNSDAESPLSPFLINSHLHPHPLLPTHTHTSTDTV